MPVRGLVLAVLATVTNGQVTVTVDETKVDLVYDGHGALSAGASSRLLYVHVLGHHSWKHTLTDSANRWLIERNQQY